MKVSKFIAEISAKGCTILRHGANHDIWYSPATGDKFALPRHGSQELPKGLEIQARKKLGV